MSIHPCLEEITRKQWGNNGIICTDGGALKLLIEAHKSFPSFAEGAAAVVKATTGQFLDAYVPYVKEALEKAGCTADMSSADICEALVAQMTQISYSGLTGKDMTWNAEGQVSKAPTAYVIKGGEYVLPEA